MKYISLGKTGLQASVMGLGCGGHSRLGLATGKDEANAIAVVRTALELGVNFIDTAESYGTETAVGKALKGVPRDQVIVSTKLGPRHDDRLSTGAELKARFEGNLARLQTDYVDILHLHGIKAEDYAYCHAELVPALEALRAEGKIRFRGITEAFGPDPQHAMLAPAVAQDDGWEVVMVGFNILNQSARERVLRATQAKGIGTLCMFACRRALSRPEALHAVLDELIATGAIAEEARGAFPTENLTEFAYRFCRHELGIEVVLSGTGNPAHVEANVKALLAPPLPAEQVAQLTRLFASVDTISGN